MKYEINNFKVIVSDLRELKKIITDKLKINKFEYKILHKSIDARDKDNIYYNYRLMIDTNTKIKGKNISIYQEKKIDINYNKWNSLSPVIVGFGPSGIFSALYLARCGAKPIIIERGSRVEKRIEDINLYQEKKIFNPNSNIAYGEGGAGTFSDGKLTTNLNDPLIRFILNELYMHGADIDITYNAKPHIGTDILREVIKNIRNEIISLGGTFYFDTLFTDFEYIGDNIKVIAKNDKELSFITNHLIMGLGHFSKETIKMLYDKGLKMEPKNFSMGVRIEHLKRDIDYIQYKDFAKYLPSAYYKFACHNNDRGIYTFCMCPGGYVVPSNAESDTICVNGMSYHDRNGINSNSALLVEVKPSDIDGDDPLRGLRYQEYYEREAFKYSSDLKAPGNLVKEFLDGNIAESERSIKTTYPFGIKFSDFKGILPDFVIDNLKYGIKEFDKLMPGFNNPDAILVGIESRSSSAIRIYRDKTTYEAIKGIYPIGEGAGYAGGIVSSALDGLKCAIRISKNN